MRERGYLCFCLLINPKDYERLTRDETKDTNKNQNPQTSRQHRRTQKRRMNHENRQICRQQPFRNQQIVKQVFNVAAKCKKNKTGDSG